MLLFRRDSSHKSCDQGLVLAKSVSVFNLRRWSNYLIVLLTNSRQFKLEFIQIISGKANRKSTDTQVVFYQDQPYISTSIEYLFERFRLKTQENKIAVIREVAGPQPEKIRTEAISMVKFPAQLFRVFMMTTFKQNTGIMTEASASVSYCLRPWQLF